MKEAAAEANTNIAFIKYWGKFEVERNLPAVGSLSMTLEGIGTITTVTPDDHDSLMLNGKLIEGEAFDRVQKFIDQFCAITKQKRAPIAITTVNSVPTASGLASSASAFAALTASLARAYELDWSAEKLSAVARRGSASAARSMLGGFVILPASAGEEVAAEQLVDEKSWDVRLVVARTTNKAKEVSSRLGMTHTAKTSTTYPTWLATWREDYDAAIAALHARDLAKVGEAMEHSTLAMHATTMTARPPFMYWNGATVECMQAVWDLRRDGLMTYFTADAGPHVKVLCRPEDVVRTQSTLRAVPGVVDVAVHLPGRGVKGLL